MSNRPLLPFLFLASMVLPGQCAGATDPSTVLILVNDLVPPEAGTGSTGASVYVGQYYASRRGIPASNIVHLSVRLACCNSDPTAWDSWNIDWATFDTSIRTPLKNFLESNGLKTRIKYIVPTYGIPLRTQLGAPYPAGLEPDSVSVDSMLTTLYARNDAPFLLNPYAVSQPGYSKDHFTVWQNPQGWPMYLVVRLDGPGSAIATGLVDKAIAAETSLGKNDGIGYFDYQDNGNYPVTDGTMVGAYNLALAHGLPAVLNDQRITGNMIHNAPQALWAWGWYSGPTDWEGYQFVNGAVGAQLTSYTANNIRYLGPGTWVPLWLLEGITATWGATGEPYTSGYANGDNLLNHFWNGYNFGESAYLACPVLNWMMVFVGDPLYQPNIFLSGPPVPEPTPKLTFRAQQNGYTYSGPLTLSAQVSQGVQTVQFQVDGGDIGPQITRPPFVATFTTDSNDNGPSLLTVKTTDAAGRVLISDPVPIIIYNAPASNPPAISSVSAGNVTATSAQISWTTDTSSDSQVDYGTSAAYGNSSPLDSNLTQSHSVVLSGLAPGTLYHYRVKSADASGQLSMSGDFTFTTGSASAASMSVAPASGSGTSQRFTFTFSGVSNVDSVNVVINSSLSGAGACYFPYEPPSNTIDLVDDSGNGISRVPIGGGGTLANSQCSIPASNVVVTTAGSALTLALTVTFTPAFAGSKTIWATWYSNGEQQTGWQAIGSWNVAGAAGLSVSPASGTGSSQQFTFTFAGVSNVGSVNMVMNSSLSGVSACYFPYEPQANTIDLIDDSGAGINRVPVGSGGTLANSQCSIAASGVAVNTSGNTLTITLTVTFTPAFAGTKSIWATWYAGGQQQTGWQNIGSWTVPAASGLSVSPPSGAGSSQRFTFTFPGVSNVGSVNMVINSSLSGAGACYFPYEPGPNTLDLVDDSGAGIDRVPAGSGGTLANSQCSIDASSVNVSTVGNTMTVALTVNFTPAFAGPKTIWASWYSGGQQQGNWQPIGSWTVQ